MAKQFRLFGLNPPYIGRYARADDGRSEIFSGCYLCPRRAKPCHNVQKLIFGQPPMESGLSSSPWGAVAQLGERLVRNEEASGSIPLSSTIFSL